MKDYYAEKIVGGKKMKIKYNTWKCPVCGKELISLYPAQLDSWQRVHNLMHEREAKGV